MASKSLTLSLKSSSSTSAPYTHTVTLTITEQSQDTTNNRTTLSYTVEFKAGSSNNYHYNTGNKLWLTIGSVISSNEDVNPIYLNAGGSKTIKSGTITIDHNSDGTKTVDIYFRFRQTQKSAYDANTSDTFTLTTIPRASSVANATGTVGSPITLKITRASTSFTHTLEYVFGSISETIAINVATAYTWTPPISLADQIPNYVSGNGRLICRTYSGTTLIGSKEATLTLSVPDYTPTLTASVSATELKLNRCVQNFSKAIFSMSATTQYSATISYFTIDGVVRPNGYMSDVLASSGTVSWTIVVRDSRGKTASTVVSLYVYPYNLPTFTEALVQRCTSSGIPSSSGTYAAVSVSATISSIDGQNSISALKCRYRLNSSSTYTTVDVTNNDTTIIGDGNIDVAATYVAQIYVTDAAGSTTYSSEFILPIDSIPFNIRDSGSGIGFGKYCEHDDAFEINENWAVNMGMNLLMSGLSVIPVVASSVSGASGYIKYANGLTLAWKQFERDNYPITKAWGSLYENTNDDLTLGDMPNKDTDAEFTATPVVFASPSGGNSAIIASIVGATTTSWGRAWVVRGVQLANTEVRINLLAVGFSAIS